MFKKNDAVIAALLLVLAIFSCKKSDSPADVKSNFVGNWAGALQVTGSTVPLKFSLLIKEDNTLINIDSAFSNQVFPGTYTYTADSLKITYNNGTKWNLRFSNNYTGCAGTFLGFAGATGTVNMLKK